MTDFKTIAKLPRLILMLTAGVILLATTDGSFAKNGGSDHKDHSGTSDSSFSRKSDSGSKDQHKDKDKYSDKDKHKDKDKDKYSDKDKHKDKDGDKYSDKGKDKDKDGDKDGVGKINGIPPISKPPVVGNAGNPPPAAAPSDPVVRDHRPGGNAASLAPGTIIRDHRNGADGKPVVVVSSSGGVTVTRPATDADLQKAGLLPKTAPAPVNVPIGGLGGGR